MFQKSKWQLGLALFVALSCCGSTWAQQTTAPTVSGYTSQQQKQRLNSGYVSGFNPSSNSMPSSSAGGRIGLGLQTSSPGGKPFSSYTSAPTVSPYLNLFRTDLSTGGNFNYSTLVQPQLQQQQINQQQERQTVQTNRRLQQIAAQPDFNPEGSKDEYPTGHQTVFNYLGHYYQAAHVQQKRATHPQQ